MPKHNNVEKTTVTRQSEANSKGMALLIKTVIQNYPSDSLFSEPIYFHVSLTQQLSSNSRE